MISLNRRSFSLVGVCLGLILAAGCGASAAVGRPTGSPPSGPVNVRAFDALARQEAAAWARSPLAKAWRTGLVVLSPAALSPGPSDGFPSGQDKADFLNGDLVFTGPAPSVRPAGVVTWPGGATMTVPVLSEARTFAELTRSRECPACATTPLDVTAAKPATLAVATSRGMAKVPAWAFTLKGVPGAVIEAALPAGSYLTPGQAARPSAAGLAALGKAFASALAATVSADGRTLTLGLYGGACDSRWGGLGTEAGGAVVVGGWTLIPKSTVVCAAVGVLHTAKIRLPAPVGDRVIIDAATGQPITSLAAVPG